MVASDYYIKYLCIFIFGHKFFLWQPCHGPLNLELHLVKERSVPLPWPFWSPWLGARLSCSLCLQVARNRRRGPQECSGPQALSAVRWLALQWAVIFLFFIFFPVVVNGGDFLISLHSCFIKWAHLRKIFAFLPSPLTPLPLTVCSLYESISVLSVYFAH